MVKKRSKDKWMQDLKIKKGALRKQLRIGEGETIPAEDLEPKPGDSAKTIRRKNLAKVFRKSRKRK